MSAFTVQPSTLDGVADAIEGLYNQLQSLQNPAQGSYGSFGGPPITGAMEDYAQQIAQALQTADGNFGSVSLALRNASQNYTTSDGTVEQAISLLTPAATAVGQGPDPGDPNE